MAFKAERRQRKIALRREKKQAAAAAEKSVSPTPPSPHLSYFPIRVVVFLDFVNSLEPDAQLRLSFCIIPFHHSSTLASESWLA